MTNIENYTNVRKTRLWSKRKSWSIDFSSEFFFEDLKISIFTKNAPECVTIVWPFWWLEFSPIKTIMGSIFHAAFRMKKHFSRKIFSFFAIRKDGILENQQTGVFRTNCIDCLDRTNVVQSLLAKRIFEIQLRQFSIIGNDENLPSYKHLNSIFQNRSDKKISNVFLHRICLVLVWADNADFISTQYAGTGALKTDFTRFVYSFVMKMSNKRRFFDRNHFDSHFWRLNRVSSVLRDIEHRKKNFSRWTKT